MKVPDLAQSEDEEEGVKNFGNGWSKSIVLENEVILNLNFRH